MTGSPYTAVIPKSEPAFPWGKRLMSIREAEASAEARDQCIDISLLRSWIYQGIGGVHLKTYRAPGDAKRVYVDLDEILTFRKKVRRSVSMRNSQTGKGRTTLSLDDDQAPMLRDLAARYARRLGLPTVSLRDALLMAVQNELRRLPAVGP
jgi:hypothetical protein